MSININTRDNIDNSVSSVSSSGEKFTTQENVDMFDKAMSEQPSETHDEDIVQNSSASLDKSQNISQDEGTRAPGSNLSESQDLQDGSTTLKDTYDKQSPGDKNTQLSQADDLKNSDLKHEQLQKQLSDKETALQTLNQKNEKTEQLSNGSELSQIFSSLLNPGSASPSSGGINVSTDTQASLSDINDIDKLNDLASSIVERILVSDPKYSSTSQIMLTLSNNSAFANMDIMLERTLDGTLAVEIYTKSKEQTKDVVRIRQNIVDALEKNEDGLVVLNITQEQDSDKYQDRHSGL